MSLAAYMCVPIVLTPKTEAATKAPSVDRYEDYEAVADVEIVDNVSCLQREALAAFILEQMRLSQNREFHLEATSAPHIHWVIATLPDAQGQVRAIGPTGKGYSASAFWRHPTERKIQLVQDSVVIKELERKD